MHPLNSKPPKQLHSAATHTFNHSQAKIKGKYFYILWLNLALSIRKSIACFNVPRLRSLVLVVRVVLAWTWVGRTGGVILNKEIRSTGRKSCRTVTDHNY